MAMEWRIFTPAPWHGAEVKILHSRTIFEGPQNIVSSKGSAWVKIKNNKNFWLRNMMVGIPFDTYTLPVPGLRLFVHVRFISRRHVCTWRLPGFVVMSMGRRSWVSFGKYWSSVDTSQKPGLWTYQQFYVLHALFILLHKRLWATKHKYFGGGKEVSTVRRFRQVYQYFNSKNSNPSSVNISESLGKVGVVIFSIFELGVLVDMAIFCVNILLSIVAKNSEMCVWPRSWLVEWNWKRSWVFIPFLKVLENFGT